jgi:hypothetical protein
MLGLRLPQSTAIWRSQGPVIQQPVGEDRWFCSTWVAAPDSGASSRRAMHRNPCPPGCNPVSTIYGTRVKTASMFANTHSGGFSSKERAGWQQPRRLGPEAAQRRGGDSSRCGMRRVSCLCMDQCRTTSVLVGIDGVPVMIGRPCTSQSENGGLSRGQMASVRVRGKASGITGMAAAASARFPARMAQFHSNADRAG